MHRLGSKLNTSEHISTSFTTLSMEPLECSLSSPIAMQWNMVGRRSSCWTGQFCSLEWILMKARSHKRATESQAELLHQPLRDVAFLMISVPFARALRSWIWSCASLALRSQGQNRNPFQHIPHSVQSCQLHYDISSFFGRLAKGWVPGRPSTQM